MQQVLTGLLDLDEHLSKLSNNPNDFRPPNCPNCGLKGLWRHGVYHRKIQISSMQTESACGKIPIPRFRCSSCGHTCSVIPECVSPRRWYSWIVQQAVFNLLLAGNSLRATRKALSELMPAPPCISTINQWWSWLRSRYLTHQFHICNVAPVLRFQTSFENFWKTILAKGTFSGVMMTMLRAGQPML
jgi:transposase-like protein